MSLRKRLSIFFERKYHTTWTAPVNKFSFTAFKENEYEHSFCISFVKVRRTYSFSFEYFKWSEQTSVATIANFCPDLLFPEQIAGRRWTTLLRSLQLCCINRKNPLSWVFSIEYFKLAMTYSPSKEVPSVQRSLTSVFGMGTGVPFLLDHQLKIFNILSIYFCRLLLNTVMWCHLMKNSMVGVSGFEPPTFAVQWPSRSFPSSDLSSAVSWSASARHDKGCNALAVAYGHL